MNKKALLDKIAEQIGSAGIQKKEIELVFNSLIDVILKTLKNKEDIKILGFITFKSVFKKPRIVVNPRDGKRIQTPGKYVVKLCGGSDIKTLHEEPKKADKPKKK